MFKPLKTAFKKLCHYLDHIFIAPFINWLVKRLSFTYYIHGPSSRLNISPGCSLVNTIFNTSSGYISIGSDTIFGHNCMVLTGRHNFVGGRRAKLTGTVDTPSTGYDISIGNGCWIASGSIIIGGVTIGNNCIVCAGAVVTSDFSDNYMIGGVPARIIRKL